jgi:hypothetical protein
MDYRSEFAANWLASSTMSDTLQRKCPEKSPKWDSQRTMMEYRPWRANDLSVPHVDSWRERFEVSVGKPGRKGFAPCDVPGATAATAVLRSSPEAPKALYRPGNPSSIPMDFAPLGLRCSRVDARQRHSRQRRCPGGDRTAAVQACSTHVRREGRRAGGLRPLDGRSRRYCC